MTLKFILCTWPINKINNLIYVLFNMLVSTNEEYYALSACDVWVINFQMDKILLFAWII